MWGGSAMTYLFRGYVRHFWRRGSSTETHLMAGAECTLSHVEPQRKGRHATFDHSMRIPQAISRRFPHAEPRPGRAGRLPGRRGTRYLIPHRHDRARPPSPSYPDRDSLKRPRPPICLIQIRRSGARNIGVWQPARRCYSGNHAVRDLYSLEN